MSSKFALEILSPRNSFAEFLGLPGNQKRPDYAPLLVFPNYDASRYRFSPGNLATTFHGIFNIAIQKPWLSNYLSFQ